MARRKRAGEDVYGELYRLFYHDTENRFRCFYCGEPGATIDHQPPVSRVDDYRALRLKREAYVKVISCKECNGLLSAELTVDLIERDLLAKQKLEKRYARLLRAGEWTEQEVEEAELHGRLEQYIRAHGRRRARVEDRLSYGGGINAWLAAWDAQESGEAF